MAVSVGNDVTHRSIQNRYDKRDDSRVDILYRCTFVVIDLADSHLDLSRAITAQAINHFRLGPLIDKDIRLRLSLHLDSRPLESVGLSFSIPDAAFHRRQIGHTSTHRLS